MTVVDVDEEALTERMQLVVSRRFLDRLDLWRRDSPGILSRSAAVRVLVGKALREAIK